MEKIEQMLLCKNDSLLFEQRNSTNENKEIKRKQTGLNPIFGIPLGSIQFSSELGYGNFGSFQSSSKRHRR